MHRRATNAAPAHAAANHLAANAHIPSPFTASDGSNEAASEGTVQDGNRHRFNTVYIHTSRDGFGTSPSLSSAGNHWMNAFRSVFEGYWDNHVGAKRRIDNEVHCILKYFVVYPATIITAIGFPSYGALVRQLTLILRILYSFARQRRRNKAYSLRRGAVLRRFQIAYLPYMSEQCVYRICLSACIRKYPSDHPPSMPPVMRAVAAEKKMGGARGP